MKRKLLWLNLALVALTVAAGVRLHQQWQEGRARERAVLGQRIRPVSPPAVAPLPGPEPVKAAGYLEIAQKMLFSKDRNPTVVVEPVKPPPPKPMPPLPVFHGMLNLGDGPTIIMSEKSGGEHRDFKAGDEVGEFKLVAFNEQQIVLEWDGKTITKSVDELLDHGGPAPAPAPAPAAPAAGAKPPAAPSQQPAPVQGTPGPDMGRGISACVTGDNSPSGTVAAGKRKVVRDGLFGKTCFWEAAN